VLAEKWRRVAYKNKQTGECDEKMMAMWVKGERAMKWGM